MAQEELTTLPVGRLGLVPLESCKSLGQKVDEWLVKWRKEREHSESDSFAFEGYKRDSYTIKVQNPRFGSGEGKCVITESVRGDDVYILVDVCNYNISYPIGKYTNLMSPDDHYQDLKRVIAAIGGKARRVNVIMPYLYEGRQSKRIWELKILSLSTHMTHRFRMPPHFMDLRLFNLLINLSRLFLTMSRDFILTMSIL